MTPRKGTPTYLTTRQACERLGVSQPTLSRWVQAEKLTPVMRGGNGPGGAMWFNPDDIDRLERERASAD